jgi:hypothetical protein
MPISFFFRVALAKKSAMRSSRKDSPSLLRQSIKGRNESGVWQNTDRLALPEARRQLGANVTDFARGEKLFYPSNCSNAAVGEFLRRHG